MSDSEVDRALLKLQEIIKKLSPLGIAVSGGVDSMTLAVIAHRVSSNTKIFHALSPAVPKSATLRVKRYAQQYGWALHLINAKEMEDTDYLRNPVNRCFFCKSNLYKTMRGHTTDNIASGTNTDDLNDYRPGLIAATDNNIYHPYVKAGIDKVMVRQLAKFYSLEDLQELPASPCLSSRILTGISIEAELLTLIDEAEIRVENLLRNKINLQAVRCRIEVNSIAIQLETDELLGDDFIYAQEVIALVSTAFKSSSYKGYSKKIIIEPYTKGSAFIKAS
jgi:pyridinium-3,5-biscarboxylic acid mononucleotide sulfurtransferase